MIKYSVIIPLYNMERYIEECINSIVCQNRNDIEIMIVNDGSTDKSLSLCENIARKNDSIVIINKENSGVMDSWIMGVRRAQGQYICFVDSDDYIDKNYFSILDKYTEQNADIVMFDYYKFSKDKKSRTIINKIPYGIASDENMKKLKENYFANYKMYSFYRWNKIYDSALLKKCIDTIDFKVTYFEDLYIELLMLLNANKIIYVDEVLYYYRLRKSSITHNPSKRIFSDNLTMKEELEKLMKKYNMSNEAIENMKEYMDYGYIRYLLKTDYDVPKKNISFSYIRQVANKEHRTLLLIYKLKLKWLYKLLLYIKNKRNSTENLFE